MLADPLLTEHYAKAGLGAVLIDQQHGLSREFVIWQLMFYMICGHGSHMNCISTVYNITDIFFAQVSWTSEPHLSVFSGLRSFQLAFQSSGLPTTPRHSSGQVKHALMKHGSLKN